MIQLTIERKHIKWLAAIVLVAVVLVPTSSWAAHQFNDVPDTNPFHDDIAWLKDAGVTLGCDSNNYCPADNVTRQQMAAFMRRLAEKQVVDAGQILGGTAYMFAQTATPTINDVIVASPNLQKNSEGGAITYKRKSAGAYIVTLPGWDAIGNVQVTAYKAAGVSCQAQVFWGGEVSVWCYDQDGNTANARFTLLAIGT